MSARFLGRRVRPANVAGSLAWPTQRSTSTWVHQVRSYYAETGPVSATPDQGNAASYSIQRLSLRNALLVAASRRIAPPLHVNQLDVSFTKALAYDWNISVNPDYALDNTNLLDLYSPPVYARHGRTSALHAMLARHIAQMVESPDIGLETRPSLKDKRRLARFGYSLDDLRNWIIILTSQDSLHAARILTTTSTPPVFIYLYFLRRRHINPEALRLALGYLPIWYGNMLLRSERRLAADESHDIFPTTSTHLDSSQHFYALLEDTALDHSVHLSSLFRASIRLLRHARRVWPEALVAITDFLVSSSRMSPAAQVAISNGETPARQIEIVTNLFNRALFLISEPVAIQPFKNAVHQEAAQAVILNHMAEHNPPLAIKREGYRGVTRVQLIHKKTPDEAEWARLKSPAWPPWKEDRTGMDANVGLEYGVSRARHVINRMVEAGYALELWERTALIYSGWDSDMSPTIQTRARMPNTSEPRRKVAFHMWAARIRSTRTVEQAWACFLSYEDERLDPHQDVYLAMFEKIGEEHKRQRLGDSHPAQPPNHADHLDPLYPGDIKEVFPPPASVHQATYTKTPPPSIDELHDHMLRSGIIPDGRTLAFLLNDARKLKTGLRYLKTSECGDNYDALILDEVDSRSLGHIPASVLTALVRLLARYPHTALNRWNREKRTHQYGAWDLDLNQPLGRAIYLLDRQRLQYRPAWNELLNGLTRQNTPTVLPNWRRVHQERAAKGTISPESVLLDRIIAYRLAKHTLSVMREEDLTLDAVGFKYLCNITENAARAGHQIVALGAIQDGERMSRSEQSLHGQADNMLKAEEAAFFKAHFWTLVGSLDPAERSESSNGTSSLSAWALSNLPRLLTTPNPAVLHAYVRALGFLKDYDGIADLVEWMREHWPELGAKKDIDRNGGVVFRRFMVALRVFLEGIWEQDHPYQQKQQETEDGSHEMSREADSIDMLEGRADGFGAPMKTLDRVMDMVDEMEEWDGWAGDEEVDYYLSSRDKKSRV